MVILGYKTSITTGNKLRDYDYSLCSVGIWMVLLYIGFW